MPLKTQEELQLPYEIKKYHRTQEQRAPPELLEISPLGKSPVITDGAITLAESGAIVGKQFAVDLSPHLSLLTSNFSQST